MHEASQGIPRDGAWSMYGSEGLHEVFSADRAGGETSAVRYPGITLPGFIIPFGSKALFIPRMSSSSSSVRV